MNVFLDEAMNSTQNCFNHFSFERTLLEQHCNDTSLNPSIRLKLISEPIITSNLLTEIQKYKNPRWKNYLIIGLCTENHRSLQQRNEMAAHMVGIRMRLSIFRIYTEENPLNFT